MKKADLEKKVAELKKGIFLFFFQIYRILFGVFSLELSQLRVAKVTGNSAKVNQMYALSF